MNSSRQVNVTARGCSSWLPFQDVAVLLVLAANGEVERPAENGSER